MKPRSAQFRALAALAFVAAWVTLLWFRFNAAPGRSGDPFPADFLRYFLPTADLLRERLLAGDVPLWNPHACSGVPFLAALQPAVLYPGSWLVLVMPAETALSISLFLHTVMGGLFTLAWLRALGLGFLAAASGGLLFAFACTLGNAFWPPALVTIAWMPAILLCIEKLSGRWAWGWWIALVLATALQILAGFTQYVVYTWYLAGPYALVRLWWGGGESRLTWRSFSWRVAGLGGALVLAAGVAAIQIVPTAELVLETHRGLTISPERVHYGFGAKPISASAVLANAVDPSPKLITPGYGNGAGYMGMPTLLVLAFGLAAARRELAILFAAGAVLSLALAAGDSGPTAPIYQLYAKLPTGSIFRDPQRFRLITFLCVIAVAAFGYDEVARGFPRLMRHRLRALMAFGASGTLAIAALVAGAEGAALRTLAALALIGTAWVQRERVHVRVSASIALLLLLGFDLHHATKPDTGSFRQIPRAFTESLQARGFAVMGPDEIAALNDEVGLGRIAIPLIGPTMGVGPLGDTYRPSCIDPLTPRPWPLLHEIVTGQPTHRRVLDKVRPEALETFYDVAGVKAVVGVETSEPGLGANRHRLGGASKGDPGPNPYPPGWLKPLVDRNEDALPRAYLVEQSAVMTQIEALERVASGAFDFDRAVILERPPQRPQTDTSATRYRTATIESYEPERVAIQVESERGGILVLSDTHYPGWRARVDDQNVPIFRANGGFRAVEVPAGRRRVVFEYRPRSFTAGAWISAASLLLLPAPLLIARRRRAIA